MRLGHTLIHQQISTAVMQGLSKDPKTLPSWLFYDEEGSKIFQQIMRIPEYYPTRCEYEIIQRYKGDLLNYFRPPGKSFDLIDLGTGDGLKTEILLKYFTSRRVTFTYRPIDISSMILSQLADRLVKKLPDIDIRPINKNYHEALDELQGESRKILLFLGANIGNFSVGEASDFLRSLTGKILETDMICVGFDLKKDPRIIAGAYNDEAKITKAFNLNLLTRINRELGGKFNLQDFEHSPVYDPETGTAKSFLLSLRDQNVYIGALDRSIRFTQWETIHTEISQKYDLIMIEKMVSEAGLEIVDLFFDNGHCFCDVLLKKSNR